MLRSQLRFKLIGSDHVSGDDREYRVLYRGSEIGVTGAEWLIGRTEGEPVKGFYYDGHDGRRGEGRTRADAVLNAATEGSACGS